MPLYLQNGKLIQKAGALGTSAGCCCNTNTGCLFNGGCSVVLPTSLALDIDVSGLCFDNTSGVCGSDDPLPSINGRYVLDLLQPINQASDSYSYVFSSSTTEISSTWFCSGNQLGQTFVFSFDWCDNSHCLSQASQVYSFDSSTQPGLCSWDKAMQLSFSKTYGCDFTVRYAPNCLSPTASGKTYGVTFTVTPL